MLSRAAANLYWLARYMERADNVARILEVAERASIMPNSAGEPQSEWHSVVIASGNEQGYFERYDEISREKVVHYLTIDTSNPGSIRSCIEKARANARAVRTVLTSDIWEALNQTWLDLIGDKREDVARGELQAFLAWVKERAQMFSGGAHATMLRDEGYWFLRLGTMIERADNTARILDVKYHILLPADEGIGGGMDYYQWTVLLRSVSASRSYYYRYRDTLRPWQIAEFLILSEEMPRSLIACVAEVHSLLDEIAKLDGRRHECHRLAGQIYSHLRYARIGDIFETGLHEFLVEFIDRNHRVSDEITDAYLQ